MANYLCPLCKQEVSKALYEKITGIWDDKEELLASLKTKEKQLIQREKKLRDQFEHEKVKITQKEQNKFQRELLSNQKIFEREKEALKKEKNKIERDFEKRLASETDRLLKAEKIRQKDLQKKLEEQFKQSAKLEFEKERRKLGKETEALRRSEKIQMDKNNKLLLQYKSLQNKSEKSLEQANSKIKNLEEQLKKDKTAQVLGLLEEGVFLSKLREMCPGDKFEHTGKGGDIIHHVYTEDSEVGIIVYEIKKVSTFNKSHIDQTYEAKQQRRADYGILVTNAKRPKDDSGFFISKGIIIIHPAGALVLVRILRDHLVTLSKLKLSKEQRDETIKAVLEYIQSPSFKNGIEGIIEDTIDLYNKLKKEVQEHLKGWEFRLEKYRNIHSNAYKIESNVVHLLVHEGQRKELSKEEEIAGITLPSILY